MICKDCGKEMMQQSVPCPDGIAGCAVYHYKWVCDCQPKPIYTNADYFRMPPAEFITLRDQFALAAMQGIIRHYDATHHNAASTVAKSAYAYADAMMKEREK